MKHGIPSGMLPGYQRKPDGDKRARLDKSASNLRRQRAIKGAQ